MPDPLSGLTLQAINVPQGYPLGYVQAGQGPLLLLVHGSLCDLRYWRWQLPALSKHYRVVAPSLRGYWPQAFSRAEASFSVRQHAADLAELIEQIGGGEAFHVLGHSRGAHVALELALQRPEKLASLILADPGIGPAAPASSTEFQAHAAEKLSEGKLDDALAGFIDTVNGPDTWRRMTGWFKDMVRDNAGTLFSQATEAGLAFELERAQALAMPVLLLGGEHSPPRYAHAMDALQRVLPQVRRDVIANASHGMNLGNAPAFNARVEQFLRDAS